MILLEAKCAELRDRYRNNKESIVFAEKKCQKGFKYLKSLQRDIITSKIVTIETKGAELFNEFLFLSEQILIILFSFQLSNSVWGHFFDTYCVPIYFLAQPLCTLDEVSRLSQRNLVGPPRCRQKAISMLKSWVFFVNGPQHSFFDFTHLSFQFSNTLLFCAFTMSTEQ